jgi:SAM-dependent methyltransferase
MNLISKTAFLFKTRAPLNLWFAFAQSQVSNRGLKRKYKKATEAFKDKKRSLRVTTDWFTDNVPYWMSLIDEYEYGERSIKVLEIGSWEGLSSHFILSSMLGADLTCVDTWKGADEHQQGAAATQENLENIESSFDENLKIFGKRLTKYKGTSFAFYLSNVKSNTFDVIYIDGSHHCDDVLIDAIKCFELLKPGGTMIFDDYYWHYYPKVADNTAGAVNVFLRLKKGSYKIVRMYGQVVIEKSCA